VKNSIRRLQIFGIAFFILGALTPANVYAAVEFFAEGAYTETELVVHIYAKIDGGSILRSAGVKLNYPTADLRVTSAVKNDRAWSIGSKAPDTSTAGEVAFVMGKPNPVEPASGVAGDRVLLGKVRFSRTGNTMLYSPVLGLTLTKAGDLSNFVDIGTPATVPESSVAFASVTVRERGDANADGDINTVDYVAIRNNLNSTDAPPYTDCNDDGVINALDYICVRNKF